MKTVLKILLLGFLIFQPLYGQKIPSDSLLKKAKAEIYNNPDYAIKIVKNLLKDEKDIDKSIEMYKLLSTANIAKRDYDISLHYALKAKELAQKTNDVKTQISVLTAIAIQYQQMQLFSKSLETLNEVDEFLKKMPADDPQKYIETARTYAVRGMIYKSQTNAEIALDKFLFSIKNFEKANKKSTYPNMSVVYYNIGYCYLSLNQSDKAQQTFEKSAFYAREAHAKSLEAFALKGVSEIYKKDRKHQEALKLLINAENLSKNIGDIILSEGIYKEMSENYLAMGQPGQYHIYNTKFHEMRFKREQNELNSINQAINAHNKETLNKTKKLKSKYNYLTVVLSVIGSIIIALLLYFILKIKKQNQKYQKEIQQLIRS
ncbi:hypothetical protein [uncultured Chryseobacterium sp.]|uniref:tetratricopeptide repeat protein n=1 Tax=uncultured Chryseobacterium sp. TaxID=259322 RepID=UPI002615EC67|nr:hypothetical protein [uncultured Chryseobacterium sp.]